MANRWGFVFPMVAVLIAQVTAYAHEGGKWDGHGSCSTQRNVDEIYNENAERVSWEILGDDGADTCNGHGEPGDTTTEHSDLIRGLEGRDDLLGEAGADVIFGRGDGDLIQAGGGPDRVEGGMGGGVPCEQNDTNSRCERIDGGEGDDDLDDDAYMQDDNQDYDRICDADGQDFIDTDDQDGNDIWIEDGNDDDWDDWTRDINDDHIVRDNCPW